MTEPKSKGIPTWQRSYIEEMGKSPGSVDEKGQQPESSPENTSDPAATGTKANEPPSSRQELLDSASQFIEHDSIRDAPGSEKTAFLESKGLTKSEIDQLLQSSPSKTPSSTGTSSSAPPSHSSSQPSSSPSSPASTQTPPIITYPEFLTHAHRPPPLITTSRLINTAYATAATTGVLWAANRYLLSPMFDALAGARHSLFEGTLTNLDALNQKLEGTVSVVPAMVDIDRNRSGRIGEEGGEGEETDSQASDPAEMFHRDVGVQTSPSLAAGGTDAADAAVGGGDAGNGDSVEEHAKRLESIRQHLSELTETGGETLSAEEETRVSVGNLQAYLEELAYGSKSLLSAEGGYGLLGEPGGSGVRGRGQRDGAVDEVAKFKTEIRSMKGALLSARNFPTGGLGRGRAGVAVGS